MMMRGYSTAPASEREVNRANDMAVGNVFARVAFKQSLPAAKKDECP